MVRRARVDAGRGDGRLGHAIPPKAAALLHCLGRNPPLAAGEHGCDFVSAPRRFLARVAHETEILYGDPGPRRPSRSLETGAVSSDPRRARRCTTSSLTPSGSRTPDARRRVVRRPSRRRHRALGPPTGHGPRVDRPATTHRDPWRRRPRDQPGGHRTAHDPPHDVPRYVRSCSRPVHPTAVSPSFHTGTVGPTQSQRSSIRGVTNPAGSASGRKSVG